VVSKRRSVITLVVAGFLLIGANLLFTAHYVDSSQARAQQTDLETRHDFCGIIDAYVATPVPRPSDPAANPSREQAYQWYVRFVTLHRKLGC